jgi:DNA-binding FadR family transcriptional regulator
VGEGIANMLMLSSISAQEVTEARRILEIGIVPLVVERATDEDLDGLERLCRESQEAVRADAYRTELSAAFHIALARASHNGAVELLVEALRGPLLESLEQARQVSRSRGVSGVRDHVALVRAIRERDAARAQDIMARHLGRTARRLARSAHRG